MSFGRGWFESEEDYGNRVRLESCEAEVESNTGNRPSRGVFESDEGYRERVTQQAYEERISNLDGARPSQGWLESKEEYGARLEKKANESVVRKATDSTPQSGFFESDEEYKKRIRKEANELFIAGVKGERPSQGWLEGDHDYRSRIAFKAQELRADGAYMPPKQETSSVGWTSDDSCGGPAAVATPPPSVNAAAGTEPGVGQVGAIFGLVVVGFTIASWTLGVQNNPAPQTAAPEMASPEISQQPAEVVVDESAASGSSMEAESAKNVEVSVAETAGEESSVLPDLFLPFPREEATEVVAEVLSKTWRLGNSVKEGDAKEGAVTLESEERELRRLGKNWKVRFVIGLEPVGSETRLVSRVVCRRGGGDSWAIETERCAAKFGGKFERKLEAAVEKRMNEARKRRSAWDR